MDGISAISGSAGYTPAMVTGATPAVGNAGAAQLPSAVQATSLVASSTNVSTQMESLISVTSGVSNSDVVNALLLMFALKMLSGDKMSEEDKKMMTGLLLLAAAGQQQQSSTLVYQSMSVSMSQEQLAYSSMAVSGLQAVAGQAAYAANPGSAATSAPAAVNLVA